MLSLETEPYLRIQLLQVPLRSNISSLIWPIKNPSNSLKLSKLVSIFIRKLTSFIMAHLLSIEGYRVSHFTNSPRSSQACIITRSSSSQVAAL